MMCGIRVLCGIEVYVYIMTCSMKVYIYVMKCDIEVHEGITISSSMHYDSYLKGYVIFYLKSKFYLLVMLLSYYEASIIKDFIHLYICHIV